MQTATINKWGNAHAVRIPSDFCKKLGISTGDKIILELDEDRIVLSPRKPKMPNNIKERIKFWDGVKECSGELDLGPAVGREIWWADENDI